MKDGNDERKTGASLLNPRLNRSRLETFSRKRERSQTPQGGPSIPVWEESRDARAGPDAANVGCLYLSLIVRWLSSFQEPLSPTPPTPQRGGGGGSFASPEVPQGQAGR